MFHSQLQDSYKRPSGSRGLNAVRINMDERTRLAEHLVRVSMLTELDGGGKFKVRAFKDAADVVLNTSDLHTLTSGSVRGIGKSVSTCITQFLETGTSDRYQDLASRWPADALSMTKVKGIGLRTAVKLHGQGYADLDALVAAAEAGTLLKGGERDDALIREVLYARDVGQGRVAHEVAKYVGEWAAKEVGKLAGVESVTVCGSVRRLAATSKDVDLIVLLKPGANRDAVSGGFLALGDPINSGPSKASAYLTRVGQSLQVDMWMVEGWHHGAALVYATGSKAHCISLRARAQARGMTMNEYGLFPAGCQDFTEANSLAGRTEEDVYRSLGLPYVDPAKRSGDLP